MIRSMFALALACALAGCRAEPALVDAALAKERLLRRATVAAPGVDPALVEAERDQLETLTLKIGGR